MQLVDITQYVYSTVPKKQYYVKLTLPYPDDLQQRPQHQNEYPIALLWIRIIPWIRLWTGSGSTHRIFLKLSILWYTIKVQLILYTIVISTVHEQIITLE